MHILWLIFGLMGAIWILWDTRKQGYTMESSIRWAIGTFFVPAAVIPFYLLQTNLRAKHQRHSRQRTHDVTANMAVKCIHCHNFYSGNPDICPHCKTSLKTD